MMQEIGGHKIEMIKSFIKILIKPTNLEHSKKDNFGKVLKPLAVIFAIIFLVFIIFVAINEYQNFNKYQNANKILEICDRYLYWYFLVECLWLSIFSFALHNYIYEEKPIRKPLRIMGILLYYLILPITVISSIPVFIIIGMIIKVASYRAKKVDNLINVWLIFFLDVFIIGALGWVEIQTKFVEAFVALVCTWVNLNVVTTELFAFLAFSEILIRLANKMVFYAIRGKRKKIQREMEKVKKNNARKTFKSGDDISSYNQNMENEISDFIEKDNNDIDYDIKYQEKTLLKIQLLFLILVGFIAAFWDGELVKVINTEIINVVTCFSLIILYLDKRESLGKIQE